LWFSCEFWEWIAGAGFWAQGFEYYFWKEIAAGFIKLFARPSIFYFKLEAVFSFYVFLDTIRF